MPHSDDRSKELEQIFKASGLDKILRMDWVEHKSKESRTKLQVKANVWRLSSLELVDAEGGAYPRIHFRPDVDERLKAKLLLVPGVPVRQRGGKATSNEHGVSYQGGVNDALTVAKHLFTLLNEYVEPVSAAAVAPARPAQAQTAPTQPMQPVPAMAAPAVSAPAPPPLPVDTGLILQQLRSLDASILQFAAGPANEQALRSRTKSYCTLFRGTLFGEATQEAVARHLAQRPAGVLVLGANPNDSGESSPGQRRRYRSLEEQAHTGLFGEALWDDNGIPQPQWNASAKKRWSILFSPLRMAGVAEAEIAFANFIPWASGNLKLLVDSLEPTLLARVIELAEDLLITVVQITRPRLVMVPESISKHLSASVLAMHKSQCPRQSFQYPTTAAGAATFNYYVGEAELGGHRTRLLHLRHPSSLQLTAMARAQVEKSLADVFGKLL